MIFFESLMVAFSTYSVVPMPQFEWNEGNMKYALCFFPAVGLLISGVYLLWNYICIKLSVSPLLFAALGTAIPILISGGIHMDGFMDTVDALSSHRDREKKLEILKDPNCGAFAVIYCAVYLLTVLGFLYELYSRECSLLFAFAFPLSRSLSGLLAAEMPNARKSGMLYAFTKNSDRKKAVCILGTLALLIAGAMLFLTPFAFSWALLFCGIWVFGYKRLIMKQFGGASGDTAGFFLQTAELCFLAGLFIGTLIL